jgi:gas vesicle structural protein
MTVMQNRSSNRYVSGPSPSGLADVIDTILDKGLVIDLYVRVSLVGIELLTIDARIVIASVDTYLRFANAVNRMDLTETQTSGIPELIEDISGAGSKGKTSGALEGVKEKVSGMFGGDDDDSSEKSSKSSSSSGSSRSSSRQSSRSSKSSSSKSEDD